MDIVRRLVEEKPVVIFSRTSCCISHSMKQLISSFGVNATVYKLDETPKGQEIDKSLQTLGQKPSIPTLFIGERHVGGAKEVISLQVEGRLVAILKEAGAIWI